MPPRVVLCLLIGLHLGCGTTDPPSLWEAEVVVLAGREAVRHGPVQAIRHATSVWQGNWFSVGIGPVSNATQ